MNASQMNLANTGIGSFNDRVREGAVGGTPFGDPREQGFATGLLDRANMAQGNDDVSRKYRMMEDGEKIIAAIRPTIYNSTCSRTGMASRRN